MKTILKTTAVFTAFCIFMICCACDSQTSTVPVIEPISESSSGTSTEVSSSVSVPESSSETSSQLASKPISETNAMPTPNILSTTIAQSLTEINGLFINSQNNLDFPSSNNLTEAQLKTEIEQLVNFAVEYDFNTLFLETNPQTDALYLSEILPSSAFMVNFQGDELPLNILDYLISYAHKKNILVYSLINPGKILTSQQIEDFKSKLADTSTFSFEQLLSPIHPILNFETDITTAQPSGDIYLDMSLPESKQILTDCVAELIAYYGIDGILIEDDFSSTSAASDVAQVFEMLADVIKKSGRAIPLGFESKTDITSATYDALLYSEVLENNLADFCVFYLPYSTNASNFSYTDALNRVKALTADSDITLYTLNSSSQAAAGNLPYYDLNYQVTQNRLNKFSGQIMDCYSALNKNNNILGSLYLALTDDVNSYNFTTQIGQDFAITRPSSENITVSYSTYYLMGTSTPGSTVYYNGAELTNVQENGLFGVFVNLSEGQNTFTFQQNGKTISRTITRTVSSSTVSPISAITQGSMFPSIEHVASETEDITVTCTAPSGAVVAAEVAGFTVTLTQTSSTNAGYPATYTGTVNLNDAFNNYETVNSGKIKYTLKYNGATTTYSSTGDLFITGKSIKAVGVVTNNVEIVYTAASIYSDIISTLTTNATDYITEASGAYYKLAMGGYVFKEDVTVLEGRNTIENDIESISTEIENRCETFTLQGAGNITHTAVLSSDKLIVTLYNTTKIPDTSKLNMSLIQSVTAVQGENSVILTFTAKNGVTLWGYDIYYGNDDMTMIYIKQKPALTSSVKKPLSGVTVVLDPGHGGKDSGALGIPGTTGPSEKETVLIMANEVKARLEQLGATVTLLRTDNDTFVYVYDRPLLTRNIQPDFFISIHQNSVAVQSDGGKAEGLEAFYYTDSSKEFSDILVSNLASQLNRVERGSFQSTYIVTRTTCAPALLLELGFMCNPSEYNDMLQPFQIYKTVQGICQSIIECLE